MFNDFYPAMPPAGTNPPQSQAEYLSPPQYQHQYQGSYYLPTPYPQEPYPSQQTYSAPYPQQYPPTTVYEYSGPSDAPNYSSPQQRSFQPAPPQDGAFQSQPSAKSWNPEQIWNEYNHPPDPRYGIPESQRGQREGQISTSHSAHHQDGPEGERGLGATVLGGGAGAFLGHKALKNHGTIGAIGGLAFGAIAANAFEHHEKEKKEHRKEERAYDEGRRSESRGIDDDDEGYYDDDRGEDYYEPRHHHHHHRDEDYDDRDYYSQDDYREDDYYRRDDY